MVLIYVVRKYVLNVSTKLFRQELVDVDAIVYIVHVASNGDKTIAALITEAIQEVINKESKLIIDDHCEKYTIRKQLQNKIENESDTTDRQYYETRVRLFCIQGCVAIIRVCCMSDVQVKEK